MKRTAGAFLVAAALGGCMSSGHRPGQATNGCGSCGGHNGGHKSATMPGVQGPWGQPVSMMAPPAGGPVGVMQAGHTAKPGSGSGVVQVSNPGSPLAGHPLAGPVAGGHPLGGHHGTVAVPPPPYGAVAAAGALQPGMHAPAMPRRTEIRFLGPDGTRVRWMNNGVPSPHAISVPGRYNFMQGAVYRLKLELPREDLPALYPTLEVVPSNARTDAFLAHSAVPVAFSNEDFDQVKAGNYVTKVVYLPDPAFQDLAAAGPEEIVSTRLEPGADPIAEAHRRGSILAVVRFGNIDLELQHSPPLMAPGAGPMGATPPKTMPAETSGTQRTTGGGVQQVGHQTVQPAKGAATASGEKPKKTPEAPAGTPKRWWNFK